MRVSYSGYLFSSFTIKSKQNEKDRGNYYDVRGIGKSRQARIYRGVVYDTSSIERILISIVLRDKNVEKTVQALLKSAFTGEIGDGRIFVIPIDDAIRIRTGERGDIALYNAELEK